MANTRDILAEGLKALGLSFRESQLEKIEQFYACYQEWNEKINLSTLLEREKFLIKHVLDSAAGIPFFPPKPGKIGDLGSGGGFPGIVLKILQPEWDISLLEVVQKKVDYLRTTVENLGLDIRVFNTTFEKAGKIFDVLTCRAFGSLERIHREGKKYLKKGGFFLAYKGKMETIRWELKPPFKKKSEILPLKVPGLEAQRHLVRWKLS